MDVFERTGAMTSRQLIQLAETQAREIERLREALEKIVALEDDFESNAAMTAHEWQMFHTARAALGESHDQ